MRSEARALGGERRTDEASASDGAGPERAREGRPEEGGEGAYARDGDWDWDWDRDRDRDRATGPVRGRDVLSAGGRTGPPLADADAAEEGGADGIARGSPPAAERPDRARTAAAHPERARGPDLSEDGDSLGIGSGSEPFVLSIRLESASDLGDLCGPEMSSAWLSYEMFGVVSQTGMFDARATDPSFERVSDEFRLRSSAAELASFFSDPTNSVLAVHVCAGGAVVGRADVDLRPLFWPGGGCDPGGRRRVSGEFAVRGGGGVRPDGEAGTPRIGVAVSIEREGRTGRPTAASASASGRPLADPTAGEEPRARGRADRAAAASPPRRVYLSSSSCQTSPGLVEEAPSEGRGDGEEVAVGAPPVRSGSSVEDGAPGGGRDGSTDPRTPRSGPPASEDGAAPPRPDREGVRLLELEREAVSREREAVSREREAVESARAELAREKESVELVKAETKAAEADLEGRQRLWEEWRVREEAKWHDKLREREAVAARTLEERFQRRERERSDAADAAGRECARLEGRLRKALAEVEGRERVARGAEEDRKAEHARGVAELRLREKVVKEEARHKVDMERAKAAAAAERAAAAEKAAAAAEGRIRQVQAEFDEYKAKQREAPETALHHEIATLKGQLAEAESRITKERSEKNGALLEREQYRANLHKLARALKRERQRTAAHRQKEMEQLHLEYVDRDRGGLALDGGRDELQRINQELSSLNCTERADNSRSCPVVDGPSDAPRPQPFCPYTQQSAADHRPRPAPTPTSPPRRPRSPTSVTSVQVTPNCKRPGAAVTPHRRPSPRQAPQSAPVTPVRMAGDKTGTNALPPPEIASEGRLSRLRRQREDLLASGVYRDDHPIVKELDRLLRSPGGRGGTVGQE